jgi:hypothetical protein
MQGSSTRSRALRPDKAIPRGRRRALTASSKEAGIETVLMSTPISKLLKVLTTAHGCSTSSTLKRNVHLQRSGTRSKVLRVNPPMQRSGTMSEVVLVKQASSTRRKVLSDDSQSQLSSTGRRIF